MMRETDFARLCAQTAANECGHRCGMVRRAEGTRAREAAAFKQARHRMQHRNFEQFFRRKRRQQAWQTLRQHGFASAGRADEEDIVSY